MGLFQPTPAAGQPRVFRNLRLRIAGNALGAMVRTGRVRLLSVAGTSLLVSLFTFGMSWYAFHQLAINNIPFKGAIVEGLFDLLFFTLGGMLVFSTGIILYASLYTAPEARFLLSSPARADHIFATKFQTAVAFSSWAFVVLGMPIFVAYGLTAGVPWYFYPLLPAYLLGYIFLPGSASAILCLVLVRFLPRNRRQVLSAAGVVVAILVGIWMYRVGAAARLTLVGGGRDAIDTLIGQFDLARSALAPNHWMTRGLVAAARGDAAGALIPLALVWSNGLLLYALAAAVAKRIYRTGYDRLAGGGGSRRVYGASPLDHLMEALVGYLDRPTRILVVKDFRTFRRDPTQWALLVLFAILILIGGTNFRQFYDNDLAVVDRFAISLINMCAVCVLLCAGLSRFIYPLISLEGRKFWILGLLPLRRRQILVGKFAFAATGAVLVAESLVLFSDILLGVPWAALLLHSLTVLVVSVGLSGLNVGLGALMPNFKESDPSKIVVGFGGTVNMATGLTYLMGVVASMALPYHASAVARLSAFDQSMGGPHPILFAGVPFGLALGAAAVWLPLNAGRKSLERMEF